MAVSLKQFAGVVWTLICLTGCTDDNGSPGSLANESQTSASRSSASGHESFPARGRQSNDSTLPSESQGSCLDTSWSGTSSVISGSTEDSDDAVGPAPCVPTGSDGSADFVVLFSAPEAGRFRFSTAGSNFDTVLHLRQGRCTGEVIACNDDYVSATSQVTAELGNEETVLVVVDGFNRAEGAVEVSITQFETLCDDAFDNDDDGLTDCADADCFLPCEAPEDWPTAWANLEDDALVETNRARSEPRACGEEFFEAAPPVVSSTLVRYAARLHSRAMGREEFFEHDSPDGRSFSDRMRQVGFEGLMPWGENIAAGQTSAAEVIQTWLDSPGHCKNIMNPEFTVMGIGFAEVPNSPFVEYWTQDFAAGD